MLEKLKTWLTQALGRSPSPPVVLDVARAKRQMEHDLRAAGHTRKAAMKITAKHFEKRLRGIK